MIGRVPLSRAPIVGLDPLSGQARRAETERVILGLRILAEENGPADEPLADTLGGPRSSRF
jgi:hypothetical protein